MAESPFARKEPEQKPTLSPVLVPWRPARDEELAELSRSARPLMRKAEQAGWTVPTFYAEGPLIGSNGEELGVARAVILLFYWRKPLEAWAWWINRGEKWQYQAGMTLAPVRMLSSTELKEWLLP